MPGRRTTPPNPSTDDPPADGTQTDLVDAAIHVFEPDFDNLNLFQKIAKITGMIGGVQKRGYNAFHKYHYVTESDLVSAVRQYLAAAGIIIIPDAYSVSREGELTTIEIEYKVTDGKESFSFRMPGYGADRGDKGVYKAITGSQKYALMKLFKIDTGDDPESDTRVDERVAAQDRPARPTRVTSGSRAGVQRGGHTTLASPIQIRRISEAQKAAGLDRTEFVKLIETTLEVQPFVLPDDEAERSKAVLEIVKNLSSEDAGRLLAALIPQTDRNSAEDLQDVADKNDRWRDEAEAAGYPYG